MNLKTTKYFSPPTGRERGMLMADLFVAMGILAVAIMPLAFSYVRETRLLRAEYFRGVAMEIVDGEMEALLAGEWRAFSPGTHDYAVHAGAATNLPPGRFTLALQPGKLRLQWQPALKDHGGPVTREAVLK